MGAPAAVVRREGDFQGVVDRPVALREVALLAAVRAVVALRAKVAVLLRFELSFVGSPHYQFAWRERLRLQRSPITMSSASQASLATVVNGARLAASQACKEA